MWRRKKEEGVREVEGDCQQPLSESLHLLGVIGDAKLKWLTKEEVEKLLLWEGPCSPL